MANSHQAIDNPRGYAFVKFHRAFRNWNSYDWFAARRKYGLAPSHDEMIADALRLYDGMRLDIDDTDMEQVRELTRQIVVEMRRIVYATGYGIIGRRNVAGKVNSYLIAEPMTNDTLRTAKARKDGAEVAAVHELIELDASLRPLLTPKQRRVWDVMYEQRTWYPQDVAAALGISNQLASAHQQSIYAKARGLLRK